MARRCDNIVIARLLVFVAEFSERHCRALCVTARDQGANWMFNLTPGRSWPGDADGRIVFSQATSSDTRGRTCGGGRVSRSVHTLTNRNSSRCVHRRVAYLYEHFAEQLCSRRTSKKRRVKSTYFWYYETKEEYAPGQTGHTEIEKPRGSTKLIKILWLLSRILKGSENLSAVV